MQKIEKDVTRYPYGPMHTHDADIWHLTHIPTLKRLYPHALPHPVVASVAMRLNAGYYDSVNRGALMRIVTSPRAVRALVLDEANSCLSRMLITVDEYAKIIQQEE